MTSLQANAESERSTRYEVRSTKYEVGFCAGIVGHFDAGDFNQRGIIIQHQRDGAQFHVLFGADGEGDFLRYRNRTPVL